jgi:hypothetical protein
MKHIVTIKVDAEEAPESIEEIIDYLRTMACVHPVTGNRCMPTEVDDEVFDLAADLLAEYQNRYGAI